MLCCVVLCCVVLCCVVLCCVVLCCVVLCSCLVVKVPLHHLLFEQLQPADLVSQGTHSIKHMLFHWIGWLDDELFFGCDLGLVDVVEFQSGECM